MKHPFIQLDPDITRAHVTAIAGWLQDAQVREYLNDGRQTAESLAQLLERVELSNLSHLFSQDGRFLMICDRDSRPVGYVRLIRRPQETELVIVIGDKACWGRHYGRQAIRDCLKTAFFEMRSERVVARIKPENERSLRLFTHLGFVREHQTGALVRMSLTLTDYLRQTRAMPAQANEIVITGFDRERLLRWLHSSESRNRPEHERTAKTLAEEIDRAVIVSSRELSQDVITMNSTAKLVIEEKELTFSLAFPHEANWSQRRISILSPVGTAVLGFSVGDRFNWRFAAGLANIQIRELLYQPEAAGHYHL